MRFSRPLLFGLILLSSSIARADDDPIKWSWHCAVSGYYGMEVLQNGTVKPVTDFSDRTPVDVNIKEAEQDTQEYCSWNKYPAHYYAEIKGNEFATLYNGNPCTQSVEIDTKLTHVGSQSFYALEQVDSTSSRHPMSLLIHRDDADWRFVLSLTSLTTERESRRLRIMVPQPQITYDPKSSTAFLTGECLMTIGQ